VIIDIKVENVRFGKKSKGEREGWGVGTVNCGMIGRESQ